MHRYELVGIQRTIFVFEFGLELGHAALRIDLIIDSRQMSSGELGCIVHAPRLDRQARARPHARKYRRQFDLRDPKNDGDRLKLRNRDNACWILGTNETAGGDPAEARNSRDRRDDPGKAQLICAP